MKIRNLILHHLLRIPLQKLGVHICKAHKFPVCTGNLLDLVVPAFLPYSKDFLVLQIGASDGKLSDPLERLIELYHLRGILIEPLPDSFKLLQEKYHQNEKITCVNCAISEKEGLIRFFCPKVTGTYGLSEFQKSGISKRSLLQAGIPETDIEEIIVTSKTLLRIMEENQISKIDLLQIDTEGHDFEIVKQAIKLLLPPTIIHFETIHLSRADRQESRALLGAKGYLLFESETDTLAYQRDLIALRK